MNENNIFKGKCYACKKWGYITYSESWSGKKLDDGSYLKGSWRNFCNPCTKKFGWSPNRTPNTCVKCSGKFLGKKTDDTCGKCVGGKNGRD